MNNPYFLNENNKTYGPSKCSVVLNNVYKMYNNENVFNGLNFTAYSGKIYAILGETQSGKSTLLSCIVGRDKIDKGHIWVLGGKPRTKNSGALSNLVGYMPQKFYMYDTLTVLELLTHFGKLYNLKDEFVEWQICDYENIFTIPELNVNISDLSFSEKRMVSFIIAALHRPKLLVLDEPTVGLDIFKRHQIWKYLKTLIVTLKPTIIVATNSIEEAFAATEIAYLKNGKIIFNEEVKTIMQTSAPNTSIDIIIEDLYTSIMSNKNPLINSDKIEITCDEQVKVYKSS